MRILEVMLAPMQGGAETLISGLAATWRVSGHHVDIVALDPPRNRDAARSADALFGADVVRVVSLRVSGAPLVAARPAARLVGLARHLRGRPYDVIHAHTHLPNFYARLAGLAAGRAAPIVTTLHSSRVDHTGRLERGLERALARRTARVVAVSNVAAEAYAAAFPFNCGKLVVIPNGVRRALTAKTEFGDKPKRFVAASRIHPVKDIVTMMVGFDQFVARARADAELIVAGQFDVPEYARQVQTVRDRLAHRDRIILTGPIDDIPGLLAQSDVFVHTSLQESQGLAVLEAASCGLPIVASDLPAVRECLADAPSFFPAGQPEALAGALIALAEAWPSAAAAALRRAPEVAAAFSLAACAERYLTVFHEARDGRAPRPDASAVSAA